MTTELSTATATDSMVSLIESYADNKAALGQRFGEWAVSAPTLEAAVAAAAMAQDELGHSRSTYPVLAKLGVEREDSAVEAGKPLGLLTTEFPDWASVIAANAVVDAILTTFAAAVRDSSIEPLAQRARKILQEEGAHRIHAEAWLTRMLHGGGADAELLLTRINEFWEEAARWPGPDDDPGFEAAVAEHMISERPSSIRNQVREWLSQRLACEGVTVSLTEPSDWSDWDPRTRR